VTTLLAQPSLRPDGCLSWQQLHLKQRENPILVDESLEQLDPSTIQAGDGGIHATLFPEEPFERGHADAVVKGDGGSGANSMLGPVRVVD
jgi:hypothetical protein